MFSALALDFDGVLFDSVPECMRLSHAVFRSIEEGAAATPDAVISAGPPASECQLFLERRGVVRPAGHYYLLWKWLREFPDRALSASEFEALESVYPDAVRTFSRGFFELRTRVREEEPAAWLSLNRPFPGVVEHWPRLLAMPRYIVTTKDRASVSHLLEAYGLSTTRLFTMGEFRTKTEPLREIVAAERVAAPSVLFVDDNASHLRDGAEAGVTVRWAAWGYDPEGNEAASALRDFAELVNLAITS